MKGALATDLKRDSNSSEKWIELLFKQLELVLAWSQKYHLAKNELCDP